MKNDLISFRVGFHKVETISVDDLLGDVSVTEGIDVDFNGRISYNGGHDNCVDSSIENNPTKFGLNVSLDSVNPNFINVYAIMQRVNTVKPLVGTDGNPLLYAFKNEKGYTFKSKADADLIRNDIRLILDKFVDEYFTSIAGKTATVVIPSGNELNNSFAGWFMDAVGRRGKTMKLFKGVLDKVSTGVVREEVLDDARSEFYKWLSSMPENKALKTKRKLEAYLDDMDSEHGGTFSYHYVMDPEIRNHMSLSMKLSKSPSIRAEFEDINECNVLLLDASISRGTSMIEAYNLLSRHYHPMSVTGLALFSPVRK